MKIIFIGSQEIGTACLQELINLEQDIKLLISCELESHEKIKNTTSELAKINEIPTLITNNINTYEIENKIKEIEPDLIIVCGWRRMIKKKIISISKKGIIVIHASLLPKYRGFAPITWPIINGEKETGITMFYIGEEIDNGDIIGRVKYKIEENDTGYSIYKKAINGARLLLKKYVPLIENDSAPRLKQNEEYAQYAAARKPEDGKLDWDKSAIEIFNLIRALSKPYPGAFTYHNNKRLFIWKASLIKEQIKYVGSNGQIVKIIKGKGAWVLTGNGILLLETVQPYGKQEINAGDYFKFNIYNFGYYT